MQGLYLQERVALRRCWGTCASPASPWPPSSRPCTRRPSPQSAGPASSRTTAACTRRPPSLLGRHSGRWAGGPSRAPRHPFPPPGIPPPSPGLTILRAATPRAGLQPPAPRLALLLLQPLLLRVGLVPSPLLHQPLVRPQAAVGGRHALLMLVEGQGQLGEVVHVLRVLPVWCTA